MRAKLRALFLCLVVCVMALPVDALPKTINDEAVYSDVQARFRNINAYINFFDITNTGKAVITASLCEFFAFIEP